MEPAGLTVYPGTAASFRLISFEPGASTCWSPNACKVGGENFEKGLDKGACCDALNAMDDLDHIKSIFKRTTCVRTGATCSWDSCDSDIKNFFCTPACQEFFEFFAFKPAGCAPACTPHALVCTHFDNIDEHITCTPSPQPPPPQPPGTGPAPSPPGPGPAPSPPGSKTGAVLRKSISPSACQQPGQCQYECARAYTVLQKDSSITLTPESQSIGSGCSCQVGTGTVYPGDTASGKFLDGSTFSADVSGSNIDASATVNGVTCTGTYEVSSGTVLGTSQSGMSTVVLVGIGIGCAAGLSLVGLIVLVLIRV